MGSLRAIDLVFVVASFVLVVVVGLAFSRRAGRSLEDYFVAGRKVPWWLAAAGMVATTFGADTPLVVCGLVAQHGVAGNWLWWCMVMSGLFTVFFTARLWHRAGVLSDVELVELRYGGPLARVLRGFRALYLALPINLIVLGWVHLAMLKVLRITLGIDPWTATMVCFAITVLYAAGGGLWGALVTDAVQLAIMMVAVTALAVFAVERVGSVEALVSNAARRFGSRDAVSVVPPLDAGWMPPLALATFFFVQWWAAWYPGSEPGGGGYVAQRIFSTRSERDGVLAALAFNVGHYALRPWPWIVVGLASVTLYPGGVLLDGKRDLEASYAQAIVDLLPAGWLGLMLAGFAAAYMSTVSTHLNWGASYLVNDVYKRFLKPGASERHLVRVSRVCTVGLFGLSLLVTSRMSTIGDAWRLLIALGSGTGGVLIGRFFWWRISAVSELTAMVASLVAALVAPGLVEGLTVNEAERGAISMLVTVAFSTACWVVATLMTTPESDETLARFVERVRPYGPGWSAVYARLSRPAPEAALGAKVTGFVTGTVFVYAAVFAIGKFTLGSPLAGLGFVAVAAVALVFVVRSVRA
ncbi:MAG: Na+:solute symporter [Myxococcaceae bacterium]|nr:Na+:solute symporter [Myxococcaceae bacterium]